MLSDYQYAVLAQMGITVFTDNPNPESKTETVPKNPTEKAASPTDTKSKISALRNSIGAKVQKAEQTAKTVQRITDTESAFVKDLQNALEQLGKTIIPASNWEVAEASQSEVSSERIVLCAQPESMLPNQKRQLWQALVAAQ